MKCSLYDYNGMKEIKRDICVFTLYRSIILLYVHCILYNVHQFSAFIYLN